MSNQSTDGTINTSTFQQTITRDHGISVAIPPRTALAVVIKTWPVNYKTTFHTTAIVEADLSQNDNGLIHLSQIYPDAQRTFLVSGTIGLTDAAESQVTPYDVKFDPTVCPTSGPQQGGVINEPYPGSHPVKLFEQ